MILYQKTVLKQELAVGSALPGMHAARCFRQAKLYQRIGTLAFCIAENEDVIGMHGRYRTVTISARQRLPSSKRLLSLSMPMAKVNPATG